MFSYRAYTTVVPEREGTALSKDEAGAPIPQTLSKKSASNSPLSKDKIQEQGYLFSSEEMKTVGGAPHYFPGDRTYKTFLSALNYYRELPPQQKLLQYGAFNEKINAFHEKQRAKIEKNGKDSSIAKKAEDRIKATKLLTQGLVKVLSTQEVLEAWEKLPASTSTEVTPSKILESQAQELSITGNTAHIQIVVEDGVKKVLKQYIKDITTGSLGIGDSSDTNKLSSRAVATYLVDQHLGLGLVPKTVATEHVGEAATLQDFAEGLQLYKEQNMEIKGQALEKFVSLDANPSEKEKAEKVETFMVDNILKLEELPPGYEVRFKHPSYEKAIPLDKTLAALLYKNKKAALYKREITEIAKINFQDPKLQKSMVDAQILDFLTGQTERNAGNFIYQSESNSDGPWSVQLIDNDLSFSPLFKDLDEKTVHALLFHKTALTKLPRLIDKTTAEKVLQLQPDDTSLSNKLAECGLSQEEIIAYQSRLRILQAHIQSIKNREFPDGELIDSWNNETYATLLAVPKGENNPPLYDNYIARTIDDQKIKQVELDELKCTSST